jgi:alkanesulfonate monooxygenase SsuD/methylene tetrahydromethanopterin reductase-like flavin-dependent oxidoreductase (luciferase family)
MTSDQAVHWQADLLTVLAVAFREVDTIEVATGVLPIQNQHPMLMAQRALTVSSIAGGRSPIKIVLTERTQNLVRVSMAPQVRLPQWNS